MSQRLISDIKKKIVLFLKSYKAILWFLVLFLTFDFIWKLLVKEGVDESILLVLGRDMTYLTEGLSIWTAKLTHWVVYEIFGQDSFKIDGITIFFENSLHIDVIWGCTGLKQFFMFGFIMLLYYGPIRKKLWYIPMSFLILLIFNIIRLALISIIMKGGYPDWFIPFNEWYSGRLWDDSEDTYWVFYKDWFNLFHRDIFKWLYYDGVIFLLWLFWEEKINKPYQIKKTSSTT